MHKSIVAGLDIGSSKVKVIIAQKDSMGNIQILGVGSSKSFGFRKGSLINIEKTTESIKQAIEEAEIMAGVQIQDIYTGLTGPHIHSQNNLGIIAISNRQQEIRIEEIERVVQAAQTMHLKSDEFIIHTIPWEFKIDEHAQIRDPIGMKGIRLETNVHIVTANSREIHNIKKSIQLCQLNPKDFILASIASAQAVLSEDEKENGTLLIDIGAGTTDIILFIDGGIRYTYVFPFAGQHINQDISIAFKIPEHLAESIKINHGSCLSSLVDIEKTIELNINNSHTKSIKVIDLSKVISDRIEEIFHFIDANIKKNNLDHYISNVVITGGTSLTLGIQEITEKIFDRPVRIGLPSKVTGIKDKIQSPIYSSSVGIVYYTLETKNNSESFYSKNDKGFIFMIKKNIQNFFKEIFHIE